MTEITDDPSVVLYTDVSSEKQPRLCYIRQQKWITEDSSVCAYTTVGPTRLFESDVLGRCCCYNGMMYQK